jgi:hypothetical protein
MESWIFSRYKGGEGRGMPTPNLDTMADGGWLAMPKNARLASQGAGRLFAFEKYGKVFFHLKASRYQAG